MAERRVGVLGASSLVGAKLLPRLVAAGCEVVAFTRQAAPAPAPGIGWQGLTGAAGPQRAAEIEHWICLAPIWVLPEYFGRLEASGARRVVALSSTSRYTKDDSSDAGEQAVARRLAQAEDEFVRWAEGRGVAWTILRPTLIYGEGRDRNIAELARFVRRFGFFPVLGAAAGLRQPVHADDVAAACVAALLSPAAAGRAYNLSGGETLSYRAMAERVFAALGRRPRLLPVPLWLLRLALLPLRRLPRFRHWTPAMAERMNRDLVFDHDDARRDLGWTPRPFLPQPGDVGLSA